MNTDESPSILAFDLRVATSSCPRTIDPNVWDQPDDDLYQQMRQAVAEIAGRDLQWTYNPIGMYLLTCIPRAWLRSPPNENIVVLALVNADHGPARDAARKIMLESAACDISLHDLVNAGWVSLGFDVADDQLMRSLLYTIGGPGFLAAMVDRGELNQHGLFRDRKTALQFAASNEEVSPHHGPFLPIQLLAHGIFASGLRSPRT